MKYLEALNSPENLPRLIPNFKQTERRLLSVFLALLSISPQVRGHFLKSCGYNSGLTCKFSSAMEVSYKGSQMPELRPDGLIVCQKGKTNWAAFIEAKSEKKQIRTDQITNYLDLAKLAGVENIITISNEFARVPFEPPYHVDGKKSRSINVIHFAWADIRTSLELARNELDLSDVESSLVAECLEYFWDEKSGILTFDLMPEVWPGFVESASTVLGFNSNFKGFSDVVYGWQQERRDLCSKLTRLLGVDVELRHRAGVRATEKDRTNADKQDLANDYKLHANYFFKHVKRGLDVELNLHASRMIASLAIPLPRDKGARATISWLCKVLSSNPIANASLLVDWPGRGNDADLMVSRLIEEPEVVSDGQKSAPKSISLVLSRHGVRNFKSRKKVITDVEDMVLGLASYGKSVGWL